MTSERLQAIVRRLANACWCRYWLHWNYPQREPWLMAISVHGWTGDDIDLHDGDLERDGLIAEMRDGQRYWVVARTEEDGQPFVP